PHDRLLARAPGLVGWRALDPKQPEPRDASPPPSPPALLTLPLRPAAGGPARTLARHPRNSACGGGLSHPAAPRDHPRVARGRPRDAGDRAHGSRALPSRPRADRARRRRAADRRPRRARKLRGGARGALLGLGLRRRCGGCCRPPAPAGWALPLRQPRSARRARGRARAHRPRRGRPARAALAVLMDGRVTLQDLDASFHGSRPDVQVAYALAGDFVADLLRRHGSTAGAGILAQIARGASFENAFATEIGEPLAVVEASYWKRRTFWNRWVPILSSTATLWTGVTLLALVAFRRRSARDAALRARWEAEENAEAIARAARESEDGEDPEDVEGGESPDEELVN